MTWATSCRWAALKTIRKRPISYLSTSTHRRSPDPASRILILCNLGNLKEALHLLRSHLPHSLPSSTHSTLLDLCIASNATSEARTLHHHLLSNGYLPDLHLSTKFIIFYAKTGHLAAARDVFDKMPDRSVISWTAMISGYSRNGHGEQAWEVFSLMRRAGVGGNQYTYGSILRACTKLGCVWSGEQVHGCIAKSRFAGHVVVESALVDLYLKYGDIEDARRLFGMMERRDVVAWNSVIGGHAVRGLGGDAFGLFCGMLRDGLFPDHFTFGHVLKACGVVRNPIIVDQIHGFVCKLGFGNHSIVNGSLIDAYAKCRSMSSAQLLYNSMVEQDLVSCTTLITGYSQEKGCSQEALELFCQISSMGVQVDDVILCAMLNVCANSSLLSLGRQFHAHTLKSQDGNDVALGNALIDMYAKSGDLQDARRAFDDMRYKNVISWTSLITGYGKHGFGDGAITLFRKMEDDGVKPNDVTFLSLLSACAHSGLTSKGMDYFNSMIGKHGIHPRAEHLSCTVDLLARGGQLKEACDFVCKTDINPSASLWGAILGACKMHGNKSLGEVVAGHLFNLCPEKSVNYVILRNIYAAEGFWDDAMKTSVLMDERYARKDAGCSFIS